MIAALKVPYGPEARSISRTDTLEIDTIEPAPLASRYGSAASGDGEAFARQSEIHRCPFALVGDASE